MFSITLKDNELRKINGKYACRLYKAGTGCKRSIVLKITNDKNNKPGRKIYSKCSIPASAMNKGAWLVIEM
jgi:hypothetical protein